MRTYIPGRRRPPVTAAIFCSASSLDERSASLTAATTRSWSISTSSGSTAEGSIVTLTSSCLPVTVTLTTPPPAVPSTRVVSSSPWIRSISCCICCAMRCRLAIPIGSLLLSVRPGQSAGTGRRLQPASAELADLADIRQLIGEDPACLRHEVAGCCRSDLDVRDDAADGDRMSHDARDARFDRGSASFGGVLQEGLL